MPVPSECEALARSIQSLVVERTALLASLAALPPRERWRAMGTIPDLDQRIESERRRFEPAWTSTMPRTARASGSSTSPPPVAHS